MSIREPLYEGPRTADAEDAEAIVPRVMDAAIAEGEVASAGLALMVGNLIDFMRGRLKPGITATQRSPRQGRYNRMLAEMAPPSLAVHFRHNLIEDSAIGKAIGQSMEIVRKGMAPPKEKPTMLKMMRPRGGE